MHPDSPIRDHQAWLGYLQPDGLVVSPAALVDAQVLLDRNTLPLQERFLPFVQEVERNGGDALPTITDFATFACDFLEWPEDLLFGLNGDLPIPESLKVAVQEGETLSPSLAFNDPKPKDSAQPWLLLVQILEPDTDLDARIAADDRAWSASPHHRFERLLRGTKVPIGLITNGAELRLIYAPHGETSGSITFPVQAMTEVAGRPILAAFHTLLSQERLLTGPTQARLPALLVRSREYQSRVSIALAQQVLDALYELLRGFQAANERTRGELLRAVLEQKPDDVYAGLLGVLMRLVFLLFAEDRGLMPTSELYVRHYAIHGLFERLRSDNEHYPDTMDQHFGAWAQLLVLFRTVFHGCRHPQMRMPVRHGHLFDPNRYAFLEGRTTAEARLPLISDGTIFRILEKLLILDGERLSYRTLDVEEIGSVYQTVMGFRLEVASGPSIGIIGKRKHRDEVAAPSVINLNELLASPASARAKWLKEKTNQEVSGEAEKALKVARSVDELLAALDKKIARSATPSVVPSGAMLLQPTDERRRSGSHYTPRSFTEPIVRKTLKPILDLFGEDPTPEQILDLKVCDLAVGSGAFLVEACRQLGDALVKAWQHHGGRPPLPADETEELLARRLVAQRCLYAVDRNPMAADLAKLSLWLVTLAKDHPFTFLDHAIRTGDSLVSLTRQQIADFHWLPGQRVLSHELIESRIRSATVCRKRILDAGDVASPQLKLEQLEAADEALEQVRFVGDLVIAAFFSADRDRVRREKRDELLGRFTNALHLDATDAFEEIDTLRKGPFSIAPFHWEIEFPEVFDRENPGFDAIVGNPPFMGGMLISTAQGSAFKNWLYSAFSEGGDRMDLVAYFFRRAFALLRGQGTLGLVATNTISQGDTRSGGLRYICTNGGTIYEARRRHKWPGQAAVVVSVIHIIKGQTHGPYRLDGMDVPLITAYLFHSGVHENPALLEGNQGKCFIGTNVLGMGFTFDDTDRKGVATSIAEMQQLIAKDHRNAARILPFIGGEEVNDNPRHCHHRYVINFGELPLRREDLGALWSEAQERQRDFWRSSGIVPMDYPDPVAADWPDLLQIVEAKIKPERIGKEGSYSRKWWLFGRRNQEGQRAIQGLPRILANCQVGPYMAFTFLPNGLIYAHTLNVYSLPTFAAFCALQSRPHEVWVRFFASTLEERLRYTATDCFETFPFPHHFESKAAMEKAGEEYYEFRAALMVKNNEGLTKTYNHFHDPDESSPDILRLRELHAAMDRAVLEAYGWQDIAERARPEFLLDYEDEEDNADDGRPRRRKKPWRYRWPDEIRDEVLARLLALNAERAEEEKLLGAPSNNKTTRNLKRGKSKTRVLTGQTRLL